MDSPKNIFIILHLYSTGEPVHVYMNEFRTEYDVSCPGNGTWIWCRDSEGNSHSYLVQETHEEIASIMKGPFQHDE